MPIRSRIAVPVLALLGAAAAWLLLVPRAGDHPDPMHFARTVEPATSADPELTGLAPMPRQAPALGAGLLGDSCADTTSPPSLLGPTGFDLLREHLPKPRKMTLRGRLIEADGAPAAHAAVGGRSTTGTDAHVMALMSGHLADEQGRFEIPVERAAEIELSAWSQRSPPTVVSRRVSPADVVDLGEVALPMGLVLEGRLLVGGAPSRFGPAAIHVWRDDASTVMGTFERGTVLDGEGRPVSASRIVLSAADGSWRAEGLSPGTYAVRVQHVGGVQLHGALVPAAHRLAMAPMRDVDFELPASLLAVAPPPAASAGRRRRRVDVTTGDDARTLIVAPQDRGFAQSSTTNIPGVERGDDVLLVPAGAALEVWVQDEGFEGWRERVPAARAGEVLRLVPTPRPAVGGWIKLRRPPAAQALTPLLRVRVLAPGTQDVVHEQQAWLVAPGFEGQIEAPLGAWTVELTPANAQQGSDGELILPQRESVEPGTSLDGAPVITWSPARGGRIRLRVTAEQATQGTVSCALLRAGRTEEGLQFRPIVELPAGLDRTSVWTFPAPVTLGQRVESDGALEPGGVTLRLACDGFEPHEEPVVIRAGEATDVTVRLVRR